MPSGTRDGCRREQEDTEVPLHGVFSSRSRRSSWASQAAYSPPLPSKSARSLLNSVRATSCCAFFFARSNPSPRLRMRRSKSKRTSLSNARSSSARTTSPAARKHAALSASCRTARGPSVGRTLELSACARPCRSSSVPTRRAPSALVARQASTLPTSSRKATDARSSTTPGGWDAALAPRSAAAGAPRRKARSDAASPITSAQHSVRRRAERRSSAHAAPSICFTGHRPSRETAPGAGAAPFP